MCKVSKGTKIHNRVRRVREETLFKLYNKLPYKCQSCCYNFNCPKIKDMDDTMDCNLYERAISLNELIEMMKSQNINIDAFCEKYGLKKQFFMEMIKGHMLFDYKYYYFLLKRLHIIDEFKSYEDKFWVEDNDEYKNKTSESEVVNI